MKKYFVFLVLFFMVSRGFAQDKTNPIEISKTIVELLQRNAFDSVEAYFDTAFARRMTVDRLAKLWKFVGEQGGAFVKTSDVHADPRPPYVAVSQTLEFEKKKFDLKIVFKKKQVASLSFIPNHPIESYQLPAYYDSSKVEEKRIKIISGKFNLPGTLSLPKSEGKFPVVVFVHGSGPNDRDETVNATKIFKDMALGIAMKGIAGLRYDKRSKVSFGKMMQTKNKLTVNEETIEDVVAAVQSLKNYPEIDTNRIYLLGHGLGGMLLPRIANQLPHLAGVILAGANARPLEDLIYDQTTYLFSKDSLTDRKKALLDSMRIQVNKIKHLTAATAADTSIKTLLALPVSYWVDLNKYHPVEAAKETNVPVYIIHGERDYQVPMTDFNLWKKELALKKNVQFKLYPKLNHLFQEGEDISVPADYDKRANVPSYMIDDIVNWIKQKRSKY